ncbi:MAG: cyclic pyranopterin monophosphate synthase MoaC [Terriglobia bacterium]
MSSFSHTDEHGHPRMVDISGKSPTLRTARAAGFVKVSEKVLTLLQEGKLSKGNALDVAKVAAIMAAKNTGQMIPLCHPIPITHVDISFEFLPDGIRLESKVSAEGKTGVEMEALTAVSVAALTLYDMCKAVDRSIVISEIHLLEKTGGKSGHYLRS